MDETSNYELIIFDCDGTLVDSEALSCILIANMLTDIGIPCTPEESSELFLGTKFSDVQEYILLKNGTLPDIDFENEYRKRSKILFETELMPIKGVEDILKNLKIRSCVASNAPHKKMDISLPSCKLDKYFSKDHIFSAYDVQKWKPDPDLFLYACKEMGVATNRAIIIEDSVPGIMGAIHAKIDVIAFNSHHSSEIEKLGVPSFPTMIEIKHFLAEQGVLN